MVVELPGGTLLNGFLNSKVDHLMYWGTSKNFIPTLLQFKKSHDVNKSCLLVIKV